MRNFFWNVFILGIGIWMAGCAQNKILPLHDDVLIFHLPYDLVYLRTEEALERIPGWELQMTEKEKGVITVHNVDYSSWDDADKREATFWVKRVAPRDTSVELATESQRVIGGDKLLKQVAQYIDQEINK